jgi:hypothetical protein
VLTLGFVLGTFRETLPARHSCVPAVGCRPNRQWGTFVQGIPGGQPQRHEAHKGRLCGRLRALCVFVAHRPQGPFHDEGRACHPFVTPRRNQPSTGSGWGSEGNTVHRPNSTTRNSPDPPRTSARNRRDDARATSQATSWVNHRKGLTTKTRRAQRSFVCPSWPLCLCGSPPIRVRPQSGRVRMNLRSQFQGRLPASKRGGQQSK